MLTALATLLLAAFLQAAPPVPGVSPGTTTAAKPAERGSVTGHVINALTGEPLKKARVALSRSVIPAGTSAPDRVPTSTDEAGRFEFLDVVPGECTLTASRVGFAGEIQTTGSATGTSLNIVLEPGQRMSEIVLRLIPQGVITGRVVDEDGEPVRNAGVYAMRPSYAQGVRRLASGGAVSGSTDDRGEYRIYGLMPGRYYVRTRASSASLGSVGLPRTADRIYPEVYYPNASDMESATRVEVQAGTEAGNINFTLRLAPAVRVRGRVVDAATGQAPQRGSVRLSSAGAGDAVGTIGSASAGAKGEFEISGLLPGSYMASASGVMATGSPTLSVRETLVVGRSGLDGVQLRLTPGAEIAGFLRTDGTPSPGDIDVSKLRVVLRSFQGSSEVGLSMVLSSGGGAVVMGSSPFGVVSSVSSGGVVVLPGAVNATGSFTWPNASPDRYDVVINGLPDAFYLKSMRFQSQEAVNTGFEVPGPGKFNLDLVVSGEAAQVDGLVLDGKDKPAAKASVALLAADPATRSSMRFNKNTATGQDGRFVFKGVPPGKYRICAWDGVEDGAWFDPDFMAVHERDGESVVFDAKEHKTLNLKVRPAAEGQSR